MPRKYVRKTRRGSWSVEGMALAVKKVLNNEMGYLKAANTYNVPRSTLLRKVQKVQKEDVSPTKVCVLRLGRYNTIFTKEQEEELVKHIMMLEERLFGLTLNDFRKLAFELAEKNNIPHSFSKTKQRAGKDWLYGFQERHKEISLRVPEARSLARAKGFNKVAVNKFYDLLESLIVKYQFTPNIYNVDETGIFTVPNRTSKFLALRGKKQVGAITSAERSVVVTVETCMSAGGMYMPPMFVFPRKKKNPRFMIGAPPGSFDAYHESGWIQKDIFLFWFQRFIKFANPSAETPVLLLLDDHASHTKSLELVNLARENHVHIICLPPHCTHRLQPLDVSFMYPLNTYYEQQCRQWMVRNPGCAISIAEVAGIFKDAWIRAAIMPTAINGFSQTGIYPFNRNAIPDHFYAPAETTDHPLQQTDEAALGEEQSVQLIDPHPCASSAPITACETPKAGPSRPTSSGSSSFQFSPADIRPAPKEQEKQKKKINRNRGATAILTSSPYKAKLQYDESNKKVKPKEKKNCQKKGNPKEKVVSAEKKRGRPKRKNKKDESSDEESNEEWLPSTEDDENDCGDACMHCNQLISETALSQSSSICTVCKDIAHDSCSEFDADDDEQFICNFCSELVPQVNLK